jgi:hypothetical protein
MPQYKKGHHTHTSTNTSVNTLTHATHMTHDKKANDHGPGAT